MPPEILDQIASFVSGDDILQLCHAIPHYKYISTTMFDLTRTLITRNVLEPEDLWPSIKVEPILDSIVKPSCSQHALGAYSRILTKHGGYARIDDPRGKAAILCDLPTNLEVRLNNFIQLHDTDSFFSASFSAKKNIIKLSLGFDYIERCYSDQSTLNMTTKWLAKLRIHELEFVDFLTIPTQIRGMLHLAPMLSSLHLHSLSDCAGIAFSACKLLRKLSMQNVFEGNQSPEALIQQLLDIVKPTKILELEMLLPRSWQNFVQSGLKDLVAGMFLQHGWREHPGQYEKTDMFGMHFACRKRE
ncbi:hypothetical protein BJ741DRAFT_639393 [Chytriomyces cf. hyalinus JEL632]|nr:hypothetical protein BJ741DRAFT_639393 [Chytriomyces cf. hyalinus JEL632]